MRENKTRYAVLGMLSRQAMSGYDIKKAIEQGMSTFWSESNGQIYPIIKQLAEEGLATREIERTEGKPDRHLYKITWKGRQELRNWLIRPPESPKYRLEFLLKLFFGHAASPEENIANIESFRRGEEETLSGMEALKSHLAAPSPEHDPKMADYWLLALDCGLKVHRAYIEWCDEAIAALSKDGQEVQL